MEGLALELADMFDTIRYQQRGQEPTTVREPYSVEAHVDDVRFDAVRLAHGCRLLTALLIADRVEHVRELERETFHVLTGEAGATVQNESGWALPDASARKRPRCCLYSERASLAQPEPSLRWCWGLAVGLRVSPAGGTASGANG